MRAYQDMVFSTSLRLTGNASQAEDISQDVFLKAYEHFDRLCASPTAGGWLKTVATHLTLNHLTRHRMRWRLFSEVFAEDEQEEDLGAAAAAFEDMPYQDIASRLGHSLAKVKTDILRGRLALAGLLRQSGLAPPPGRSGTR